MIKRIDNRQASSMDHKVNQLLKNSKLRVINSNNVKEKQLGKREFHLNTHGNVLLVIFYIIPEIRSKIEIIMIQILLLIMYFL